LQPELGLERFDLMADGALGDAQFLGRAREALVPGGGFEGLERVERRQAARHGATKIMRKTMAGKRKQAVPAKQFRVGAGAGAPSRLSAPARRRPAFHRSEASLTRYRRPLRRSGPFATSRQRRCSEHARGETMRAEVQNVVDEIKQSVGLLRRHL